MKNIESHQDYNKSESKRNKHIKEENMYKKYKTIKETHKTNVTILKNEIDFFLWIPRSNRNTSKDKSFNQLQKRISSKITNKRSVSSFTFGAKTYQSMGRFTWDGLHGTLHYQKKRMSSSKQNSTFEPTIYSRKRYIHVIWYENRL